MSRILEKKHNKFPLFIVDAFTTGNNEEFTGNPATVCLLTYDDEISDETKLNIGKEMTHSNTAYVSSGWSRELAHDTNENTSWSIRWVTPETEVSLCGHGTLAAAHIIFSKLLRHREVYENETPISFQTKSKGKLGATINWSTGIITLDFPACSSEPMTVAKYSWLNQLIESTLGPDMITAFVDDIQFSESMKIILIRLKVPEAECPEVYLKKVIPDTVAMFEIVPKELEVAGVCVTVAGNGEEGSPDFYSRVFQPWLGLIEDPVSGSLHTVLTPYWTKVLGAEGQTLLARVASSRGGDLFVQHVDDRVRIGGKTRMVLEGELKL